MATTQFGRLPEMEPSKGTDCVLTSRMVHLKVESVSCKARVKLQQMADASTQFQQYQESNLRSLRH
jgi:hypothetical protein